LDRRLQEDWAKDAREGPRVLMSLGVDFGSITTTKSTFNIVKLTSVFDKINVNKNTVAKW